MSTQFARKNLLRAPIRTQKTASPACRFTFKKRRFRTTIHIQEAKAPHDDSHKNSHISHVDSM